jgi:prepilin signal peptidase PulO-like enzyme (type II secretory pathway)
MIARYNGGMSYGMLMTSVLVLKSDMEAMNLSDCPYCGRPGMVTTMRPESGGLEVAGKCTICGYAYDTGFDPAETAHDLPGDFSRPLEPALAD